MRGYFAEAIVARKWGKTSDPLAFAREQRFEDDVVG